MAGCGKMGGALAGNWMRAGDLSVLLKNTLDAAYSRALELK